jgi:hypothetical protein
MIEAEELVRRITALTHTRRQKRPILEAWSFRIEKRLHDDLKRAGRRLDPVAMSDIINGLLEIFLPLLLAQRTRPEETAGDKDREALVQLLAQAQKLLDKQT